MDVKHTVAMKREYLVESDDRDQLLMSGTFRVLWYDCLDEHIEFLCHSPVFVYINDTIWRRRPSRLRTLWYSLADRLRHHRNGN
jgi:hypothetical protein